MTFVLVGNFGRKGKGAAKLKVKASLSTAKLGPA